MADHSTPPIAHPLPGLPGALGITVTYGYCLPQERSDVIATLPVTAQVLNPAGTVHAATVVALADTACGYGCLANLPPGKVGFTTVDLTSNFVGTAKAGEALQAAATAVHLGGTTQVWDATVSVQRSGATRTVAVFRCTQMLLSARTPQGTA